MAARGSTLRDQQYRDLYGKLGRYQLDHKVYGRSGLACPACGRAVQRVKMGARSAFCLPRLPALSLPLTSLPCAGT